MRLRVWILQFEVHHRDYRVGFPKLVKDGDWMLEEGSNPTVASQEGWSRGKQILS